MRRVYLATLFVVLAGLTWSLGQQPQKIAALEPVWWQAITAGGLANYQRRLADCRFAVIAIDTSGSIKWAPVPPAAIEGAGGALTRLEWEKAEALGTLQRLASQHLAVDVAGTGVVWKGATRPTVVVYAFNDDIRLIDLEGRGRAGPVPLRDLFEVRNGQVALRASVENAVNAIKDTNRLTWLNGAIATACPFTQTVRPDGILFLYTDGIPTTPNKGGLFDPIAARRATVAEMAAFLARCSTVILTGIDVEGTPAETFLRGLGGGSEGFLYVNAAVCRQPELPQILSITFAGLTDRRLGLRSGDAITVEVHWRTTEPRDVYWALLWASEEGSSEFEGIGTSLGARAEIIGGETVFGAATHMVSVSLSVPEVLGAFGEAFTVYIQAVAWRPGGRKEASNVLVIEVIPEASAED